MATRKKTTKAKSSVASNKGRRTNAVKKKKSPPRKHNYCTEVKRPPVVFSPNVSIHRSEMIVLMMKKWVNGTELKYYFFKGASDGSPISWKGAKSQQDAVRASFKAWKDVGIGLVFTEVNDPQEAQVRIGFERGAGSWSYVGRDIIDIANAPSERTMNIGWDIKNDIDTAIHEIGHTLGAPHEHQNPNAGIVWNEEAVYAELAGSPNYWDRDTTFRNIIRKLPPSQVEGSNHDPNSVMHYPFGPGLIESPAEFANGINPAGGLSAMDKDFVKEFYPALTKSDYVVLQEAESAMMDIAPKEQKNFTFKPTRSKKYTIQTFGAIDTVMVLFEKSGSEEIYLSGDDDSGTELNSKIEYRLIKGREYVIRVRLFYVQAEGNSSVMIY